MLVLVWGVVAVVIALAAIHAYWGFGGYWPGNDERSMVEHVVGRTPEMRAPASVACFAVALALLACAGLAAVGGGLIQLGGVMGVLARYGLFAASAVFLLRGIAGYVPAAFAYAEGMPFHHLNRVLYSPLCLLVGAALLVIAVRWRA